VFKLKEPSEYTDYVTKDLAKRSDSTFVAVSNYLGNELVDLGVPRHKITVIPNTVNNRFFQHRKTEGFYDGSRPLKLLCIGRTIKLKGHNILIEALAQFKVRFTNQFNLTLVYGNGTEELESLIRQTEVLGLKSNVNFEPFVDFGQNPDFISRFDCYIHPSTFSDDFMNRSETFGIAVLEAIAAGLPVIVTNAGGLPEVIGQETPHSRIVSHGDSKAICDALIDFCTNQIAFSDNKSYAQNRLEAFSAKRQISKVTQIIERICGTKILAALFSTMTKSGAGYAALRLHRGLNNTSISSTLFTAMRDHADEHGVKVIRHPSGNDRNWYAMQRKAKVGHTIFNINKTSILSENLVQMVEDFDLINLHWTARLLSIENIATLTQLRKPVVITIRDMLPLTGGCHYFHGCDRWMTDCSDCQQIPSTYSNYPHNVLHEKREHYNFSNLTIVTLSNHTREIVERAPYFKDCRLEVIPNSIETDVFKPHDKVKMRRHFNLPQDRKIIGFVPSFSSEVKGYREVTEAFNLLLSEVEAPFVMLVGNETPATKSIRLDKKNMGYVEDKFELARIYSAADVVVVPSLEETFSNTTAEAISCGVPVVGFKTGAIPDLVIDGKTGYTYEVGDVIGLSDGLKQVLSGPSMGNACRAHAEEMLQFMTQAFRYEELFRELVVRNIKNAQENNTPRIISFFEKPTQDLLNIAVEI